MILTVGGTKGGSGKTTLATNIAIYLAKEGRSVMLVDADEQGSSSQFFEIRSENLADESAGYTCVQVSGSNVHSRLKDFAKRYDDVIVDTGGRDTTAQRSSLLASDAFLIPLVPSAYDIWTASIVNGIVKETKLYNPYLKSFCVLNRVPHTSSQNHLEDCKNIIHQMDNLTLLEDILTSRAIYGHSATAGLSIY
ncbi:chromosome partitioning protein ParA, partial [Siphonobacter sp. BAB-5405]